MAASASAASDLQIPTITEDNLWNFHRRHFAQAPLPSSFFLTSETTDYVEVEDDGLGYYPDSVKRTLTDEQIAMFRHSEIQTLLKEKRLQEELGVLSPGRNDALQITNNLEDATQEAEVDHTRPDGHSRTPADNVSHTTNGKKRKRNKNKNKNRNNDHLESGEERTYRRIARELDEQKAAPVELDY